MNKILLIDDDPAARQATALMLRSSGHDVMEVDSTKSSPGLIQHALLGSDKSTEARQKSADGIIAIKNIILENSILGVAMVRERHFVWANRRMAELVGISLDKIIGASTRVIYPSDEAYEKLGRQAYPTLAAGGRSDNIVQLSRGDGTLFWCRFIGQAPNKADVHGGTIWMLEDITQRVEAEERLRLRTSALQAAANGIVITDLNGRILWVNPGFERLTGYSSSEAIGGTPAVLKSGKHDRLFYENMWQTILAGKVWHGELINRRKDGSLYDEEMTITPVRNEKNEPDHFIAVKQDVSQRKEFEQKLSHERDLLQSLMDNLPDYIYFKDASSRFTRINLAHAQHLGLKAPEEAIGKSDLDFFPDEAGRKKVEDEQALLATGQPILGLVEEAKTDTGNFWVSSTKVPMRDENGQFAGIVGISRNITNIMEAEKELQTQKESFRTLADNVPDAVARMDPDFRIVYGNKAFSKDIGLELGDFIGKTVAELNFPNHEQWESELTKVFQSRNTCVFEFEFSRQDGINYREARLVPELSIQDHVEFVLAVVRDTTEQRRAEREQQRMELQLRQAQKLEAIGQLAAGIAHEINTPTQYVGDNTRFLKDAFKNIGSVLGGYGELLAVVKAESSHPDLVKAVEELIAANDLEYLYEQIPSAISETLEGVERVTKIVRAMKEFSHPGSREKASADLNKAIESTVTVTHNEWTYVAEVEMNLEPNLPPVACYLGEFNQCMLNLIVNAAHAIADVVKEKPGTKGLITISTLRDGDYVEVRVNDSGTGIAENHRAHIFEPFFTTKDVGRGTGQGLAMVYNSIVKMHGGTATFETELGKGTTFILRLPFIQASGVSESEKPSADIKAEFVAV